MFHTNIAGKQNVKQEKLNQWQSIHNTEKE